MNRTASWLITLTALLLTLAVGVPDGSATFFYSGDVIRTWNEVAFGTARVKNLSDAKAARAYAMVNVAMYDAVNGIFSKLTIIDRQHALVPPSGAPAFGHPVAAAAAAAHAVLLGLFPDQSAVYNLQLAADLAALGSGPGVATGQSWGVHVGGEVLTARAADGISGAPDEMQTGIVAPGQFRATWTSQARHLAPFAIADPSVYVGSGPPALDGLDYAATFAEVKLLGNLAIPDQGKLDTYNFWALGGSTNQPAGGWLQVAIAVSGDLHLADTARLFALVSLAMVDTVAPTYQTKWQFHFWRPTTAIREATTPGDTNPYTDGDAAWAARASTVGGSPEHWSGHSSFSTAAAKALQGFFCADAAEFSLLTDGAPGGVARTYSSFSEAADEAGISRVVGGIHFNVSGNLAGAAAGRAIANEVLATKLLLKHGPTHFGECPR